jgi:hypothetical protein
MTSSSSSSPATPRPSICRSGTSDDQPQRLDIINFPPAQTIRIVADLLENITTQNDKLPPGVITHFHSRSVPKIPIHAYLTRIQKFAPFSNEILITILVYFDRIARRQSSFVICSYNLHRLLITRYLPFNLFFFFQTSTFRSSFWHCPTARLLVLFVWMLMFHYFLQFDSGFQVCVGRFLRKRSICKGKKQCNDGLKWNDGRE